MKRILAALSMIFCLAAPAMAGDVKVSGEVELQYRLSSDNHATQGDDVIKFESIYIKLEKEVSDNISAMVMLDGADMNEQSAHDHSMVEEAQIIFKNIAGAPLTLYVGKDEMPWVQDYEKFLFNSAVHLKEVDKKLGFHGKYKIDGVGAIDLAFFERDTDNKPATKYNTGLTDSYTLMVKADKLVENLSLSAGYMVEGKDEGAEVDDKTGFSVAGKYKVVGLTVYAEMLGIEEHDGTSEENITQAGLEYGIGSWLLKGRYEIIDDDKGAGDDDTLTAVGVTYNVSKNAYIVIEHETADPDGGTSTSESMLGFVAKF